MGAVSTSVRPGLVQYSHKVILSHMKFAMPVLTSYRVAGASASRPARPALESVTPRCTRAPRGAVRKLNLADGAPSAFAR